MEQTGAALQKTGERHKLTLQEVEKRSVIFAEERVDPAYRVSASWLDRIEREQHELTVKQLLVLSHVYGVEPEQLFRFIYPDLFNSVPSSDRTKLLSTSIAAAENYKWGIIGSLDRTLAPLLPVGSVVQIDTGRRAIDPAQQWTHELERPIYFLKYKINYFCGWCEVDEVGSSLTLLPHPLSGASMQYWKDRNEVEVIGRVIAIEVRFDAR